MGEEALGKARCGRGSSQGRVEGASAAATNREDEALRTFVDKATMRRVSRGRQRMEVGGSVARTINADEAAVSAAADGDKERP